MAARADQDLATPGQIDEPDADGKAPATLMRDPQSEL